MAYSSNLNSVLNTGYFSNNRIQYQLPRNVSPNKTYTQRKLNQSPIRNLSSYVSVNQSFKQSGVLGSGVARYNLHSRNGSVPNLNTSLLHLQNSPRKPNICSSRSPIRYFPPSTMANSFVRPISQIITPIQTPNTARGRVESYLGSNEKVNIQKNLGFENESEKFCFSVKFTGKFEEDAIFLKDILGALPKDIQPEFHSTKHKITFTVSKSDLKINPLLNSLLHKVEKTGKKAKKGLMLTLAPEKKSKQNKEKKSENSLYENEEYLVDKSTPFNYLKEEKVVLKPQPPQNDSYSNDFNIFTRNDYEEKIKQTQSRKSSGNSKSKEFHPIEVSEYINELYKPFF